MSSGRANPRPWNSGHVQKHPRGTCPPVALTAGRGDGGHWVSLAQPTGGNNCLDFVTQFPQGENFCRIWALGANVQLHRHRDQVPHASHGHVSGKC